MKRKSITVEFRDFFPENESTMTESAKRKNIITILLITSCILILLGFTPLVGMTNMVGTFPSSSQVNALDNLALFQLYHKITGSEGIFIVILVVTQAIGFLFGLFYHWGEVFSKKYN